MPAVEVLTRQLGGRPGRGLSWPDIEGGVGNRKQGTELGLEERGGIKVLYSDNLGSYLYSR